MTPENLLLVRIKLWRWWHLLVVLVILLLGTHKLSGLTCSNEWEDSESLYQMTKLYFYYQSFHNATGSQIGIWNIFSADWCPDQISPPPSCFQVIRDRADQWMLAEMDTLWIGPADFWWPASQERVLVYFEWVVTLLSIWHHGWLKIVSSEF